MLGTILGGFFVAQYYLKLSRFLLMMMSDNVMVMEGHLVYK